MAVQFAGITIPGIVTHYHCDPPAVLQKAVPRWGIHGVEVVTSRAGARQVYCTILIHNNFANFAALRAQLDILDQFHGVGGSVVITTPTITRRFDECIFFGPTYLPGPENGPVQDVAGALDGGWWQIVSLNWLQTRLNAGQQSAPL